MNCTEPEYTKKASKQRAAVPYQTISQDSKAVQHFEHKQELYAKSDKKIEIARIKER